MVKTIAKMLFSFSTVSSSIIEGVGRRQGFLWSLHFSAVARFELKGISVLASAWSHFQLLLGDSEQMFGSASLLYRRQLNTAECYVW